MHTGMKSRRHTHTQAHRHIGTHVQRGGAIAYKSAKIEASWHNPPPTGVNQEGGDQFLRRNSHGGRSGGLQGKTIQRAGKIGDSFRLSGTQAHKHTDTLVH